MSLGKIDKLARMANQIGDYFQPMSDEVAISGVAGHIKKFWTPKMIRELQDHAGPGGVELQPRVAKALTLLQDKIIAS